jgi:Asp-tRNA(Asn)/Glu-tRNA(Gln) amidotransferase A subunit family amidase
LITTPLNEHLTNSSGEIVHMQTNDGSDSTRRDFLVSTGVLAAGLIGAPALAKAQAPSAGTSTGASTRPASPATGGTVPGVNEQTFAEAEKLAGISFSDSERKQMARSIGEQVELLRARIEKKKPVPNILQPALTFDPRVKGVPYDPKQMPVVVADDNPGPLPQKDEDIAFAPLTRLSKWIERKQLTSQRLTQIYIERLKRYNPKLNCVITLTEDLAKEQAAKADQEIAQGNYKGPLHGIPWGAKDLFDTQGIKTTWGAEPYADRVATGDATVVKRLADAGAVLVAKLALGALAYGDIWFGGRTNNPWKLSEGSSGSSSGPAAATAAGLVGFSVGTETYGSITSPCMRCGTTGLRPTFGRISRYNTMSLCWSLDKIGPICRTVEDCALVMSVINGGDAGDPSSIDVAFNYDGTYSWPKGLRVGYNPEWFSRKYANEQDTQALDALKRLGCEMVVMEIPDWPYDTLLHTLTCEAAAAFEELTRNNTDDKLKWQDDQAWPNTFRKAWFIPGPELVQADRFRRQCVNMMFKKLIGIEAIIAPMGTPFCLITNFTGNPSLTLRCGFKSDGTPHGISLYGKLFEEGSILRIGAELERHLNIWDKRPNLEA